MKKTVGFLHYYVTQKLTTGDAISVLIVMLLAFILKVFLWLPLPEEIKYRGV